MHKIPEELNEYFLVKQTTGGGQSKTFIIAKDNVSYLLKQPIETKLSTEQRFRFRKEAEALQLMGGKGTPKVIKFSFDEIEPYILMEFIDGKNLSEFVNGKPLDLETALALTFKILTILGKVHEAGLLHRDIKPDNVLVDNSGEIFLVDFGLCRITDELESFKTPAGKELGNRFLRLPELGKGQKTPSSVSDVTFVVGLLFFMLTGQSPNLLLDEYERPPHRRGLLGKYEDLKWLTYTFDKGFAYQISQRFQSTDMLEQFIINQKAQKNDMNDSDPAEEFSKL
jgi:serine/threonine protein kinase